MRGDFIGVWPETWRYVWAPLARMNVSPVDLFSELYRDLVPEPKPPVPPPLATIFDQNGALFRAEDIEARAAYDVALKAHAQERSRYETLVNGASNARAEYRFALLNNVKNEADAIRILERAFDNISDHNIGGLSNRFFILLERFIDKFSLRYDIRRPFTIHTTISGVFAQLIYDLKSVTGTDATLHTLMLEFESAIRDLRLDRSSGKIKSCIQKQINLLEAMGSRSHGVSSNTLGRICDQVGMWPHEKVKDAMKALYGFSCDYPGIRHGGTAANQLREIEMRDLVSVTLILAGFSPYLTDLLSPDYIYQAS